MKENTLASMRDAVLHGADMVEFDVQVSRYDRSLKLDLAYIYSFLETLCPACSMSSVSAL